MLPSDSDNPGQKKSYSEAWVSPLLAAADLWDPDPQLFGSGWTSTQKNCCSKRWAPGLTAVWDQHGNRLVYLPGAQTIHLFSPTQPNIFLRNQESCVPVSAQEG